MKLYKQITVDLYNPYPLPKMTAQQNNIGRGALVTLTAEGTVIDPLDETVTAWSRKKDGTVSYIGCEYDSGKIKIDFTNQMLAIPGELQVEIRMTGAECDISTPIFIVDVGKTNIDNDAIESHDEFPVFQQEIAKVNHLSKEIHEEEIARKAEIDIERKRINQLAALEEGSTTADAELMDIRVGADGTTYDNAGEAVRAQVSGLKSDLSELSKLPSAQYIDHNDITIGIFYNHNSINKSSGSTACILNYPIRVYKGVTYYYTNLYAYFCNIKYDDGTIEALSNTTSGKESGNFTPLKNGKLYVTMVYVNSSVEKTARIYNTSEHDDSDIYGFFDKRMNGVDFSKIIKKNEKSVITEDMTTFLEHTDNLYDKSTMLENVRISNDGTSTETYSGLGTSDYIYVAGLESVKLLLVSEGSVLDASAYICLYDDDKTPICTRTLATGLADTSNACYIRMSIASGQNDIFMVVKGTFSPTEYIEYGWKFLYSNEKTTILITPSDDIIEKIKDNKGCNLHFTAGNYDIIQQYKNHYGDDYFDNYNGYGTSDDFDKGLIIYNGTKVTFSRGAYFTANYSGSNTSVKSNFSAFAIESGVTIDGLVLNCSGIRNCIHDDFDNNSNGTTNIKNCYLSHDGNVIAGGLGFHEVVIIENCIIKRTTSSNFDFSYHNNGNENAQNTLIIKDNYLENGVSIRWYGQSTLITDVMISNNSMSKEVEFRAENTSAVIENISIKKWNNEIRTN